MLQNAVAACRAGVNRVHILDRHRDGILLSELFTRDGAGTLITAEPYELTRARTHRRRRRHPRLIAPMEAAGILVKRSRELLEQEIDQFTVVERDGTDDRLYGAVPVPEEASPSSRASPYG